MNRRDFIYAASAGAASAAASPVATLAQNNPAAAPDARQPAVKLRTVTLEEHFATPAFAAGPGKGLVERLRSSGPRGIKIAEQLLDVGDGRVAEMDAGDIDIQVLSLNAPGVEQVADPAEQIAIAREANDFVLDVVKKYPKRFAAFAALPVSTPELAADELELRVRKQGFKGTMINGHAQGEYLDDKKYWGIFEAAQALDVPIYLHPREPHPLVNKTYFENYPELQTAAWGFAMETCTHFLRLVFAGVFDAYPRLKFILGHMGEGLPFWLNRFEDHTRFSMQARGLKRGPRQYLTENLVITCSGNFSTGAFLCAVMEMGIDNVLFSVDWPYESNRVGVEFLKHLPLSPADKEKFAHGNAERVLKL